jgi:hypothetical protein
MVGHTEVEPAKPIALIGSAQAGHISVYVCDLIACGIPDNGV